MTSEKQRQKRREGDVVRIPLNGEHGYGRVLSEPLFAFYNLKAQEDPPLEEILRAPIAFKVWVMNHAVTKGRWQVIGNRPLSPELQESPVFFRQDALTDRLYFYYEGGREEPASFEDVKDLERAAVWEPEAVEERLRDYFAGRPCKWVEGPKPMHDE